MIMAASIFSEMSEEMLMVVVTLTGIIVVTLTLALLIGLIKIYSGIVNFFINKSKNKKTAPVSEFAESLEQVPQPVSPAPQDGLSNEIVAVIAAAVSTVYGEKGKNVVIKSINRSSTGRPIWGMAGVLDNTKPF